MVGEGSSYILHWNCYNLMYSILVSFLVRGKDIAKTIEVKKKCKKNESAKLRLGMMKL